MNKQVICPNFRKCTKECIHRKIHPWLGIACEAGLCTIIDSEGESVGPCIPMSKLKYELIK